MADKGFFGLLLESALGIDIYPKKEEEEKKETGFLGILFGGSDSQSNDNEYCRSCHYCKMDSSSYKFVCEFYFENYNQDPCDSMYGKNGVIGNEYDTEKKRYCSQRY